METAAMNVIIPMGGIGSRFIAEQYRFPKPLVRICGREMILWLLDNLHLVPSKDIIWLALPKEVDTQFLISNKLRKEFPQLDIRVVPLQFQTRGAVETLYAVLQEMSEGELSNRTISLDCDTFYFTDILTKFRSLPPGEGASFCFEDTSGRPIFSFIKLDEDERILDIREKVIISTHANTGAYAFGSAKLMHEYCSKRLDQMVGPLGEYYTSSLIKEMISDGHVFKGIDVPDFACVGTPKQLHQFLTNLREKQMSFHRQKNNDQNKQTATLTSTKASPLKRRFCFDLDGTLVTFPEVSGDYSTVRPVHSNIKLAQELHAAGHTIIIHTARRMKTHNGDVEAVKADIGKLTMDTLVKFKIPYDELFFGKPYADCYIDDNAVHAQMNTFKEVGWLNGSQGEPEGYWEEEISQSSQKETKEFIKPRSFNTIMKVGDVVIKTGPREMISGENYFYKHIPDQLRQFFPQLKENPEENIEENDGKGPLMHMHLEYINGTAYSLLAVGGKCVTEGRMLKLMNVLNTLHSYNGPTTDDKTNYEPGLVYENYSAKLKSRYEKFPEVYDKLGPDAKVAFVKVVQYMDQYEKEDRAERVKIIHGDPVLTNVILTKHNTVKLLDMRGLLGNTLALQGDATYDLAKVYQSLLGYDFFLNQQVITPRANEFLASMRETFWSFIGSNYPRIRKRDIEMITASLYFSLIPLHESATNHKMFFNECLKIIESSDSC